MPAYLASGNKGGCWTLTLVAPLKLVIVVSCRHCPHQTLDNSRWGKLVGMDSQRWRADLVKLGSDSFAMIQRAQRRASFKSNSSCCSRSGDAMNPNRV